MKYIDPTMHHIAEYQKVLDDADHRLMDRYNGEVIDVEYNIGYSARHRNPFCLFKVLYFHRGEEHVDQFLLELHDMDLDKSLEDVKKYILHLEDKIRARIG